MVLYNVKTTDVFSHQIMSYRVENKVELLFIRLLLGIDVSYCNDQLLIGIITHRAWLIAYGIILLPPTYLFNVKNTTRQSSRCNEIPPYTVIRIVCIRLRLNHNKIMV